MQLNKDWYGLGFVFQLQVKTQNINILSNSNTTSFQILISPNKALRKKISNQIGCKTMLAYLITKTLLHIAEVDIGEEKNKNGAIVVWGRE